MDVVRGLEAFPRQPAPVVLALGTFDGVHRGHQALLWEAVRLARSRGGRSAAITFDPHPLAVVAPPPEPFLLTTLEERLDLLAGLGIDLAVVVRFDAAFRQIPAEAWLTLLREQVAMRHVICGSNYTFGHDRGGTVDQLRQWSVLHGIELHVIPPVHIGGTLVSSTLIRRLIQSGEVREAARYLGRWYTLRGIVQHGDGRGRSLGFPTANLAPPDDKLLPAPGIYAGLTSLPPETHHTAISIGTRPTFGPGALVVEAYVLDFAGDLYGASLELRFVHRLRDELAFTSEAALVRQIRDDVAQTRRLLTTAATAAGPA